MLQEGRGRTNSQEIMLRKSGGGRNCECTKGTRAGINHQSDALDWGLRRRDES